MKTTFVILCLPFFSVAQNPSRAVSLIGGIEYKKERTYAWNIEANYNRSLEKHPKWSFERGLNFSVQEYNADPAFRFDTTNVQLTYGEIFYPNGPSDIYYSKKEHLDYARLCMFRLQGGLNRNLILRERLTFSVGLNLILNLKLGERQAGRVVWVPSWPSTTYKVQYSKFERKSAQEIGITIEPHADLGIQINRNLWFTSRLAYYILDRPQLDIGCTYRW